MYLISIDPGKRACSWASFWSAGASATRLMECGMGDIPLNVSCGRLDVVVLEDMQYYPNAFGGAKAHSVAAGLLELQAIGNYAAGVLRPKELVRTHPAEWKGQVPKEVTQRRVWMELDEYEREILVDGLPKAKSLQHNVHDAVGIGLWYLKTRGIR